MTSWNDGTANQFTATGAATYASSVSALNNMPAVYFNGAQTMLTANMSSVFSSSTGGMLFVLYAPNTSGGVRLYYAEQCGSGASKTGIIIDGAAYLETFLNATGGRTRLSRQYPDRSGAAGGRILPRHGYASLGERYGGRRHAARRAVLAGTHHLHPGRWRRRAAISPAGWLKCWCTTAPVIPCAGGGGVYQRSVWHRQHQVPAPPRPSPRRRAPTAPRRR